MLLVMGRPRKTEHEKLVTISATVVPSLEESHQEACQATSLVALTDGGHFVGEGTWNVAELITASGPNSDLLFRLERTTKSLA